jgi:ABC-2 type transport system ATP-binding protein
MLTQATPQTVLTLKNLKMSFGAKEVLRGVELEAGRGEIIGYIGPNGAGKSTTVKIMLGLIEGYSGTVEILGEDIRTCRRRLQAAHRLCTGDCGPL